MKRSFDFSEKTKKTIAERASLRCSNPICNRPTSFAHSNPLRATRIGKAAHIESGASGGPRVNLQSPFEYLRSVENGIWLCANCHDAVDADCSTHSVSQLKKWKYDIERRSLTGDWLTSPPSITWVSHSGHLLPQHGQGLPDSVPWKHHTLRILNDSRDVHHHFVATLSLPEHFYAHPVLRCSGATKAEFRRKEGQGWIGSGCKHEDGNVDDLFELVLDALYPGHSVTVNLASHPLSAAETLTRGIFSGELATLDGGASWKTVATRHANHIYTELQFLRNTSMSRYTSLHIVEWNEASREGSTRLATLDDAPHVFRRRYL